jgi:hypothetical protein
MNEYRALVQWALSQCHFSTTNATRHVLGLSPDICGERPVTKCLKNAAAHMGRCSSPMEGNVMCAELMQDLLLKSTACKGVTGRQNKVLG